ncbi:uncharacterized protein HaLaN_18129 [Haematococcus lacustris]|uniref:Uncharacterized protein n=1 Tax=Haematococcus lacustris TaxID=44745 RepID=A0A699ZY46_HAELA|nr:uncharacterized protein HaLaN_18129 [Haematococcus lacustris]
MVWEAVGRDTLALPLLVMMLHLAVGDCWIGIASALIYSIWDLNGRAALYPTKGESRAIQLSSSP